ncbi:hypothetical protein GCM10023311_27600 [Flaviramulus aquimarinus]|uniref:Uncharacterized protein n=1 Tax=Flaviramulus aquimarinus TaxID=1170456 RepID=A0ABP9FF53_9FLAO
MKKSSLHNIKSTGFKTPDDYFESFDEKFLSKLNNENHLESIKKTGFKVPDNYFESFDDKILTKDILNTEESKLISLFSKKNLVYISSIAAAILLLFNLSIFDNNPSFSNLDIETVENYIIEENISSYELAALLSDEQIIESINIEHDFNNDHIEDYLLNNADIEALMIE